MTFKCMFICTKGRWEWERAGGGWGEEREKERIGNAAQAIVRVSKMGNWKRGEEGTRRTSARRWDGNALAPGDVDGRAVHTAIRIILEGWRVVHCRVCNIDGKVSANITAVPRNIRVSKCDPSDCAAGYQRELERGRGLCRRRPRPKVRWILALNLAPVENGLPRIRKRKSGSGAASRGRGVRGGKGNYDGVHDSGGGCGWCGWCVYVSACKCSGL